LERAGLLLSAEQQRRIKHTGWWMVAVAVLGLPVAAVANRATGVEYLLVLPLGACGTPIDKMLSMSSPCARLGGDLLP
jgi:hypothetical protein